MAERASGASLKQTACAVGDFRGFAELTTVVMTRQLLKKGRRTDARRLLRSFLAKHQATPKVVALLELAYSKS